jgi:hypothetical protein
MLTFGGALVGLRAETEHQVASSQMDRPLEGSKASGKITTALKRLCDATNIDITTAKSSKFGIKHDNAIDAIRESRDAGRLVSQQNASKWQISDGDINTDKWFQTRHVQQPMLSDVAGSQPSATKDLAALYYVDRDGESIKVAYSGAALNECTPLQDGKSPQEVKQIANQWNRRPLMTSSTICCTFEHSTEKDTGSKVLIGTRTQDNNGPNPSNTKRKLQALVGSPGACTAKSAYSDARRKDEILGLVTGKLDGTDAPAARWSALGDAVCGIVEEIEQDRSSNKRARVVSAYLEDVESAMIHNKMCGQSSGNGKTKQDVSSQSILLSSCSAIAKKIAQKKSLALDGGAAGELESISLESVPSATDNDQGSTKIRYGVTPSSSESEDPRSILSLLRSCIVGMLAKRLAAPGEASIPVGEIEAATLLDAYRKAIKNPRTKKMAIYLVTKADEFFAKMKQKETEEEDGNDDEAVDVESVFLLYNQLRAIPLPLG